ncbi:hypothetical protein HMPREF1429_01236 [Helicobacter pylori GAM93Bi]|nr:hypothetical protein HMPREF1429_01236 [Helicobacter pylori GAM93Bi]
MFPFLKSCAPIKIFFYFFTALNSWVQNNLSGFLNLLKPNLQILFISCFLTFFVND